MIKKRLTRIPLSPVDNAWLRMEHPTNLMMITGFFVFDQPLDLSEVKDLISKRLLLFDRFRQRVVQPRSSWLPAYWEDDPHFDLNSHLHRIALPAPGNKASLQELVNDLMSTPLDFSKPLWQMHLVENYGGGCALVCRLHHCMADGIALMRVLLSLTDDAPDSEEVPGDMPVGTPSPITRGTPPYRPLAAALKRAKKLSAELLDKSLDAMSDPEQLKAGLKVGAEGSAALAHLLLLSPDPVTPYKGKLGAAKVCGWTQPLLLSDVKAIGRVTGGTVNDVLLTAVAGALGSYLRSRGEPIGGLNFRAVVPVNLRPANEELTLGNAFGLVFLSLPVGIEDPLDRLNELRRRMDGIKGTPEAVVAFGILNAIGIASREIEDIVVGIFGQKATTVVTNVPGPREVRYFAGKKINQFMFWVPQSGRLGLGVSILSYAGEVLVGIATDSGLTPDPDAIVALIHEEFEKLMDLVRMVEDDDEQLRETKLGFEQCHGTTLRGSRCKNRAAADSRFCHRHRSMVATVGG